MPFRETPHIKMRIRQRLPGWLRSAPPTTQATVRPSPRVRA